MIRTLLFALVLTSLGLVMTGCNTVHGVGQDTKNAGQHIENTADANK